CPALRLSLFPYTTLFRSVVDTSSDEASVNAPPATDGDGAFSATIGFDEPGEYVIQVSVNKGAGGQEQAVVTVEAQTEPEDPGDRSEEHTSELQSRFDLVC